MGATAMLACLRAAPFSTLPPFLALIIASACPMRLPAVRPTEDATIAFAAGRPLLKQLFRLAFMDLHGSVLKASGKLLMIIVAV